MASRLHKKYKILSGPSRWNLMMATFDRTSEKSRPVTFTLDQGVHGDSWKLEVVLTGLNWKDLPEEEWKFEGTATFLGVVNGVNGFFYSDLRKGHLEIMCLLTEEEFKDKVINLCR